MQRRHFIGLISSLLPGLAIGARSKAEPTTISIQESPIAGFQYHQGEALWPQLAIGQPLTLHREPDNRYDPRAVRIDWQEHKLGYIPRRENIAVAQMLDRGRGIQAKIVGLGESQNPWERVMVSLSLRPRSI